jgi:hypothetical protein
LNFPETGVSETVRREAEAILFRTSVGVKRNFRDYAFDIPSKAARVGKI